eukprot:3055343-Alexandrium_andersonii.AAC.1
MPSPFPSARPACQRVLRFGQAGAPRAHSRSPRAPLISSGAPSRASPGRKGTAPGTHGAGSRRGAVE